MGLATLRSRWNGQVTRSSPARNAQFTQQTYPCGVTTCVIRVGMPDRPGALGAVASRIGAVHADVVGIEILTRTDGRAMDDITVELDGDLLPLLLSEIAEVDGVVVEAVHKLRGGVRDRRLDSYRTAAALLEVRTPEELLTALAVQIGHELDADWVAILDTESELLLASNGRIPGSDWLAAAFRRSSNPRTGKGLPSSSSELAPKDLVWTTLERFDAALCTGRPQWPFSEHEMEKLATIARMADARWSELGSRRSTAASGKKASALGPHASG